MEHRPTLDALADHSFCRVAESRQFDGNTVRLLRDGVENYPAWLRAIATARERICLENYLIFEDEVGHSFAQALTVASKRGVACQVLYDWLGCVGKASRRFWDELRAAGVEVRCYNRPGLANPLLAVSRDHRKLLCVDGEVAYTGGLCIGQQWLGDPGRGIPAWRDTAVEIRGPAARYLAETFDDSWRSCEMKVAIALPPRPEAVQCSAADAGPVRLWVIPGHPDSMGLYRLELLVAEIVERSLWLADAYFVATTAYVRALTTAVAAGVDVRLLVPSSGDVPLVGAISRSAYRPLLEGGVRVFEWNGPMMHAKTAVADGCWSRIGSSNSNLASWITNRELDVTIHDREIAGRMETSYLLDLENATEIVLSKGRPRMIGNPGSASPLYQGKHAGTSSRFLAGVIGFGGTVGATLARRRTLGTAEVRTIGLAGLGLVLFALMAVVRPWLVAVPFAVAMSWLGANLLIRAARLLLDRARNR